MIRAAALAAVALAAAGCDGGSDRLSERELRERANAICARYDEQIDEVAAPTSADEVARFAERAAELTREGVAELRALEPPAELEEDYARFLAEGDGVVALSERLARAARAGDVAELETILAEAQESERRSDRIARELGLDDCAD